MKLLGSQNKASEAEGTTPMLRENKPRSPSKVESYDRSKAVIIRWLTESDSTVPTERIQNSLHQFTETVNTVFKNSQEIRVRKANRMGSTYCNKDGEQRPRPLKVILESGEIAQRPIDTKCIRRNS